MQKLFIISNESIYENNNEYFCDNIDLKSTPEGLDKNFEVNLIARKSKAERAFNINLKNIKIFSSIFSFISSILNSTKNKNSKYKFVSKYKHIIKLFTHLPHLGHTTHISIKMT